jgi:hypothetical protein
VALAGAMVLLVETTCLERLVLMFQAIFEQTKDNRCSASKIGPWLLSSGKIGPVLSPGGKIGPYLTPNG